MVISPASISARLIAFTRVADRPSASWGSGLKPSEFLKLF
jgi:hypothetical protein